MRPDPIRRWSPLDVTLLAGLLLLIALLLGPALTIPLRIPINYNEGWNAGLDTRAVTPGSGPLYPGAGEFLFDNYPPLGFLLVGAIGRFLFGGAMIEAGRVVAALSMLATGGLIAFVVRSFGGSPRACFAASLLMLLTTTTFYHVYVAMDDPQWLAHAVMLTGAAVLLGRGGLLPWWRIAAASALMVAGGFIKHNLIALPLATTVWLLWRDRRAGLVWIAAAGAWLAIGFALCWHAYGQAGFDAVVHHRRIVHYARLLQVPERLLPMLAALVVVAVRLRRERSGDGAVFAALFLVFALATGAMQRIGDGVSYNAQFETLIAVSVGFGLALEPVRRGRDWKQVGLCLLAASPVIGAAYWHLPIAWHDVVDRERREAAFRPIIGRLAAADGPIGCEMMSLCYWAGHPSAIDMFNLTESVLAGASVGPFRAAVARHAFALVQDRPSSPLHLDAIRQLGSDPVMGSLAGFYVPVMEDPSGWVLLAPRDAGRGGHG